MPHDSCDPPRLPRAFYDRDPATVARALLGQRLARIADGQRMCGLISETEAYGGPDDQASHAFRRTPRSAIMYGPPGFAYVYFIYGMYFCLNAVAAADGHPGAVLIRGVVPQEGITIMRSRRPGVADAHLADGPGKVCQAFGITRDLNAADLTASSELWIEAGPGVPASRFVITPRIGVRGDAAARNRLWRFLTQP